jgi:hypothetical protein
MKAIWRLSIELIFRSFSHAGNSHQPPSQIHLCNVRTEIDHKCPETHPHLPRPLGPRHHHLTYIIPSKMPDEARKSQRHFLNAREKQRVFTLKRAFP